MPASQYSMTLCVQPSIRWSAWHKIAQIWRRNLKWSGKSSIIKSMVIYRAHLKQPQWTGLLYKLYKYIKQNYWHALKSTKTPSNQTRIQKQQQQQKKKRVFSVFIKRLAAPIWKGRLLHGLGATAEEALSPLLLSLRLGISKSKSCVDLIALTAVRGGRSSHKYGGAMRQIMKIWTGKKIGSKCREACTDIMWLRLLFPVKRSLPTLSEQIIWMWSFYRTPAESMLFCSHHHLMPLPLSWGL